MNIKELSNILPLLARFYIEYPAEKRLFTTQNIVSNSDNIHQHVLEYFLGGCLPTRKKKRVERVRSMDQTTSPGRTLKGPKLFPKSMIPQESCLERASALKPNSQFSSLLRAPLGSELNQFLEVCNRTGWTPDLHHLHMFSWPQQVCNSFNTCQRRGRVRKRKRHQWPSGDSWVSLLNHALFLNLSLFIYKVEQLQQ